MLIKLKNSTSNIISFSSTVPKGTMKAMSVCVSLDKKQTSKYSTRHFKKQEHKVSFSKTPSLVCFRLL